jgi:hypothetical protein
MEKITPLEAQNFMDHLQVGSSFPAVLRRIAWIGEKVHAARRPGKANKR